LASDETLESGKPISQAKDEISSAAGIWYYAASLAQHAYGDAHNALGPDVPDRDGQGTGRGIE
jgi:betaine-aldehyde dehydrogenase